MTFGFIYLDYYCCLEAGRFRIEKSPIRDIETIFRLEQCDPTGCILCVSLGVCSFVCVRACVHACEWVCSCARVGTTSATKYSCCDQT